MGVGDDAAAAGYDLVPASSDVGGPGKVRQGSVEINRTRDYIARLAALVPISPTTFRTAAGISSGTDDPSGGADGDIYFKIVS